MTSRARLVRLPMLERLDRQIAYGIDIAASGYNRVRSSMLLVGVLPLSVAGLAGGKGTVGGANSRLDR